jgi:hypothetical protein
MRKQGQSAGRQPKLVRDKASPAGISLRDPRLNRTNLRFAGDAI